MQINNILKDRKIATLFILNISLFLLLIIGGYLATKTSVEIPSYANQIILSHQYIEEVPEGVKVSLDCEEWKCTKFSNRTSEIASQDSASYVYLKDFSDNRGPNSLIFYADDYRVENRFCDIVDDRLLEIRVFWKEGVNCNKILFGDVN